jgi:type IV secretion system protein VirD4
MKQWLRFPLGVASLAAGGGLLAKFGTSTALALTQQGGGVDLPNLYAIALGSMAIGGAWDLLVGRRPAADKVGVVAKSVFATRRHIDACGISEDRSKPNEGLYLGFFCEDGKTQLRYRGPKHGLFFGTPGANKSMGLVVPNLAHLRRSMIVIDPKGQLAAITAGKRQRMGRVIILNPFGVLADELPRLQSTGWNPLLQLDPQSLDFEDGAGCIADAIIEKSDAGNSKFFDNSAENLVTALVMWERYSKGAKANLCNIRAELCKPTIYDKATKEPVSGFLHTLKQMAACDVPAIADAGGRLSSRLNDPNSQSTSAQDVIDTVLANTRFLSNQYIKTDMAKGGAIDFGALHREVTTIYLILPPYLLVSMAKWLRLFVNLSLMQLYKHPPTRGAALPPVLFMLDEFGNLGRLSQILNALNISRDYSLQLWMFLQNSGQLKAAYPKEYASFYSGAGFVSTFATADNETAELLSKLLGNEEKSVPTESVNGTSIGLQAIPLIRPEDLGRLGRGETVGKIEPCPWPVRGIAPVYTQTPFANGLDPNPYYRG